VAHAGLIIHGDPGQCKNVFVPARSEPALHRSDALMYN